MKEARRRWDITRHWREAEVRVVYLAIYDYTVLVEFIYILNTLY